MASLTGTYVPTYQGLSAADLIRPASLTGRRYPFDAPHQVSFYRATSAIYHLFRELVAKMGRVTVLVPDYNSGNEILAMRAAGASIAYCPVDGDLRLNPDEVERLCKAHRPDLLYVIHYFGWAQPMPALTDLCRRRGMLLLEDCALSLLSEIDGQPLGTFADWAVFCLYKTLAVPDGALLVQNGPRLDALERLTLSQVGSASILGRTAELLVQRIRSRSNGVGAALQIVKRGMGRAAGAMDIHRANVGNIGLDMAEMDLAMSHVSTHLLNRMNLDDIRRRRIENYRRLDQQLPSDVVRLFPELPDGACPLFFPIVVPDKHGTVEALHVRGVDAIELWNESVEPAGAEMSGAASFLRRHVVEIPIHQDLTARHIDHVARQVAALTLQEAA